MNEQSSLRVAALEQAQDEQNGIQVVIAELGETAKQALDRLGIDADVDALLVVFG